MTTPTPQPSQASIEAVAIELARSYWRGQLETALPQAPRYVTIPMVEAAALEQKAAFWERARVVLCQIGHTEPLS